MELSGAGVIDRAFQSAVSLGALAAGGVGAVSDETQTQAGLQLGLLGASGAAHRVVSISEGAVLARLAVLGYLGRTMGASRSSLALPRMSAGGKARRTVKSSSAARLARVSASGLGFVSKPITLTVYSPSATYGWTGADVDTESVYFYGAATGSGLSVSWSCSGATTGSGTASGTSSWSFTVPVSFGNTTVTITATGSGGSATKTVSLQRRPAAPYIGGICNYMSSYRTVYGHVRTLGAASITANITCGGGCGGSVSYPLPPPSFSPMGLGWSYSYPTGYSGFQVYWVAARTGTYTVQITATNSAGSTTSTEYYYF